MPRKMPRKNDISTMFIIVEEMPEKAFAFAM
jgi:hypothetical protein